MIKTFDQIKEENEKFLVSFKNCEKCINGEHTKEEHAKLYNRAYSKIRDYNRTKGLYRRGSYDMSKNNALKA